MSALLAFGLVLALLPVTAFATAYDGAEAVKNKLTDAKAELLEGNIVRLKESTEVSSDNIIVKGDVILDLNGFTLTLNGGLLGSCPAEATGSLTIRDSSNGAGKITGTGLDGELVRAQAGATVTIEGGTIENTAAEDGYCVVCAISGSKLNMSGGSIIGQKIGLQTQNSGTVVTVTGGTISTKDAMGSAAVAVTNSSTFTMTGGTINSPGQAVNVGSTTEPDPDNKASATLGGNVNVVTTGYTELADLQVSDGGSLTIQENATVTGTVVAFEKGTLNITGGTITSTDKAVSTNGSEDGENSSKGAVINITGGTITGGADTAAVYAPAGEWNITGGTITGGAAVLARGGKVDIGEGAALVSNATGETVEAGDAGYPVPAGALTVDNANYPAEGNVGVTGGSFTGNVTYSENRGTPSAEANDKLTVSGGSYTDPGENFKEYLAQDKAAVGVGETTYVGAQAEEAVSSLKEGDKLTVLQSPANNNLQVPAGVEVDNQTGGDITINGEQVKQDADIYTVDDSALLAVLAQAEALAASDYTAASWGGLETALADAKAVLENKTLTDPEYQGKLDAAAAAVQAAMDALVKASDAAAAAKAELKAALDEAKKGTWPQAFYTPESYAPIANAQALLADDAATPESLAAAKDALKGVELQFTGEAQNAINAYAKAKAQAEAALRQTDTYTADSLKALETKLAELAAAFNRVTTPAELNEVAAQYDAAFQALEKRPAPAPEPEQPTTTIPQTGDDSAPALWLVMMAVSACGLGTLLCLQKRRKSSK